MDKFDKQLYKLFGYLCSILMFTMMSLTFGEVVCRYVIRNSLTWSEELGRYIFVWITFIGMALALYKGGHVALDMLVNSLHGTAHKLLVLCNNILIMVFAAAVVYSGYLLYQVGLVQRSSAMDIKMNYVYIVVPVSGALLLYFTLRKTYKDIKSDDSDSHNTQQ